MQPLQSYTLLGDACMAAQHNHCNVLCCFLCCFLIFDDTWVTPGCSCVLLMWLC